MATLMDDDTEWVKCVNNYFVANFFLLSFQNIYKKERVNVKIPFD